MADIYEPLYRQARQRTYAYARFHGRVEMLHKLSSGLGCISADAVKAGMGEALSELSAKLIELAAATTEAV